jgi:hypothetical protein
MWVHLHKIDYLPTLFHNLIYNEPHVLLILLSATLPVVFFFENFLGSILLWEFFAVKIDWSLCCSWWGSEDQRKAVNIVGWLIEARPNLLANVPC